MNVLHSDEFSVGMWKCSKVNATDLEFEFTEYVSVVILSPNRKVNKEGLILIHPVMFPQKIATVSYFLWNKRRWTSSHASCQLLTIIMYPVWNTGRVTYITNHTHDIQVNDYSRYDVYSASSHNFLF